MEKYLTEHIIEIAFSIISTIMLLLYKKIKKLIKTIESNKTSMLVLIKNLFIQKYYYYKRENYICIWEKDALKNLYKEYKKLDGNGIVDDLFEDIEKIPITKEEENGYIDNK